jgi:hypothetical protein
LAAVSVAVQRLHVLAAWALAWALLAAAPAQTLNGPRESAVKAVFLVKFASYVEWPPAAFAKPDEPLAIGVLGDDALFADLERLAQGQSVNGHPVLALRLRDVPAPGERVHILYLAAPTEGRLRELVPRVAGPVLVVTHSPGALGFGADLNFVLSGGRLRFEAAPRTAAAHGLKLSSRLLAVASSIGERAP